MTTIVDLAFPPSLNTMWRFSQNRSKPYFSERYQAWKSDSDERFLQSKKLWRPVKGNVAIHITLDEKRRRSNIDCDNRGKPVLDWLQRACIIENDALCDKLEIEWGEAPTGCRVKIQPSRRAA